MTMHFRALADNIAADGAITPQEILSLRQTGWSDGAISPEEAEAVFAINDRLAAPTAEWSDFFVEALSEFVVNGLEPGGYVEPSQADWLIARIDHNGCLDSLTELELLVKVLEKATNVPQRLKDYGLAQIEAAVLTGEGPTRAGGVLEKGNVTSAEVALLRRMIFAQAGDRPAAVSQSEAEMLFRLKDTALDANNAPEWQQLFVQGVGNYLMAFSSYAPLSNERAAQLEKFMDSATPSLLGFAARMARADVGAGMRAVFGRKAAAPDQQALLSSAEQVTHQENTWLQGQIDANDRVDEFDQALLDFLKEEGAR